MAGRTRSLTESDAAIWEGFAGRVAPLRGRRPVRVQDQPPAPDVEPGAPRPEATVSRAAVPVSPLGIGGPPAGIDKASWEKFRRGQIGGVRKLDLHGMTVQEAFSALRAFLRGAHADGVRCVEVVTGRGDGARGGALRRELPLWLNLPEIRPLVLAAAHPRVSNALHANLANPGAVRLLLRRPRGRGG